MFSRHMLAILQEAETTASSGGSVADTLAVLRQLSLDDFATVIYSLPVGDYPSLSRVMPPMSSVETQKRWTGASGPNLVASTSWFGRLAADAYMNATGRSLAGRSILDLGCGYGRMIRLFYYYTDPQDIMGVDPWQVSIDECLKSDLPSTIRKSDILPETLPTGGRRFDLVFSFSVATHLDMLGTTTLLRALRTAVADDGVAIVTIRPVEFWAWREKSSGRAGSQFIEAHERDGYAFDLMGRKPEEHYGDSSFDLNFFRNLPGWRYVGYDRSKVDALQVAVILKPISS